MNAQELRRWRAAHHLSQAKLARLLKVKVLTIIRWENGHTSPPEYLELALAHLHQQLDQTPAF